jgi:tRNA-2-methylthio-N6-dimethylallyladenosine synthase
MPPHDPFARRKVYVDTYGCQMNQHDSLRMFGLMAEEGYAPTIDPNEADLIILNSCSVREKAEQKVLSAAGEMKRIKKARPDVIVAIGGCVAQQEGQKLLDRVEHVDIVFGPDHIARLPQLVQQVRTEKIRLSETQFLEKNEYVFPPLTEDAPLQVSAFVTVMKGCDKFCTFCIVPFTRGREISRQADEIVEEVRGLAAQGTREVVLLGQTVNSYGRIKRDGHIPFHELIQRIAEIDGIDRIRFTSPHPSEFSDDQILAFRDVKKLCPHMHLPVQSGSTKVLQEMRRGYSREEYLAIVRRLREVAPQVSLTTDIIVGFPGETQADFEETLSLMDEVRFQGIFSFAYSERVGTRALKMDEDIDPEERLRRLYVLQEMQERISQEQLRAQVGTKNTVLIEGPSKTDKSRSTGRTGQNRAVHVDGTFVPGTLLEVEIVEAFKHSLRAKACLS